MDAANKSWQVGEDIPVQVNKFANIFPQNKVSWGTMDVVLLTNLTPTLLIAQVISYVQMHLYRERDIVFHLYRFQYILR